MNLEHVDLKFIYAPLTQVSTLGYSTQWYDKESFDVIKDNKFDCVIVDGPAAHGNNAIIRYPAMETIVDQLFEDYCIFLDDINRSGEQIIQKKWCDEYNLRLFKSKDGFCGTLRKHNMHCYNINL